MKRDGVTALGIGLVAAAVFAGSLAVGFVSDDFLIIRLVRDLGGLHQPLAYFRLAFYDYYRPMVFLSHALDWTLWGPYAPGFHATSVLLHAFNAAMVYFVARLISGRATSAFAALLFAAHPTNQETVYWVAGRFDLLAASGLIVSLWLLARSAVRDPVAPWREPAYWAGTAAFAVALLSKESGIVLLLMITAYDVLIARRGWREVVARLVPLGVVAVAYMTLRSAAAGLAPTGGAHRAGKAGMLVVAIVLLLWCAYRRFPDVPRLRRWLVLVAVVLAGGALAAARLWPALAPSVGFPWYAAYYLGPLAWVPAPGLAAPGSVAYVLMGAVVIATLLGSLIWWAGWWRSQPALVFAGVLIVAALIPVSAMPSRNHLYLATFGASLFVPLAAAHLRQRAATALLALLVVWGGAEALRASRDWRRAGAMTANAVALISPELQPCGTRDVLILITPAGVRGVPCNITEDSFRQLAGCAPGRLRSILRVVGGDVTVEATALPGGVRFRIDGYRGNLVGTRDLRQYAVQLPAGVVQEIDTPLGRLSTRPDGAAQLFDVALAPEARGLPIHYYSDGAVHRLQ